MMSGSDESSQAASSSSPNHVTAAAAAAAVAAGTAASHGAGVTAAQRRFSSDVVSAAAPSQYSRHRKLSIQPRSTQYEPHPLLQGGCALEDLLGSLSSGIASSKLQPRGAQMEHCSLMQRTASGLTELEVCLQDHEREAGRGPMLKAVSVDSTGSAGGGGAAAARRAALLRQQSMPETAQQPRSIMKLEPRVLQYEQHALLAERDASGLTILDAFLAEKEEAGSSDSGSITSKGKCSEKCTCKNANCTVCKAPPSSSQQPPQQSSSSTASSTSETPSTTLHQQQQHPALIKKESSRETVIEPKANNKRVHFSESGEDENNAVAADDEDNVADLEEDKTSPTNNKQTTAAAEQNSVITNKSRTAADKSKNAKTKRKCVIS